MRIDMHRLQELVRLHRMGTRCREVARLLGMSPNTERAYREALSEAGLLQGEVEDLAALDVLRAAVLAHKPPRLVPQHVSTAAPWMAEIERMAAAGCGPRAIYDTLRLQDDGFTASLSAIKRACARLEAAREVDPDEVAIAVETDRGHSAQVDFGYAGQLYDPDCGRLRRAWVFVMVLGFSRHVFVDIVFDQRTDTWLRLHARAFAEFGGVPEVIVPDNLKAAVVRAAFGVDGPTMINRSYRELARHYNFKVDPTPVYSPEKKGKVESGVKYVKRSFLKPRRERDVSVLRPELRRWVYEIAGQRNHGTTGRKPLELFEQVERAALSALADKPFEPVIWKEAKVHRDTHIVVGRAFYSVPWRLVGKTVLVRLRGSSVEIYFEDSRVATHPRVGPGQRNTIEDHLPAGRSDYRHRSREYWEKRADTMGEEVGAYIRAVFDSDDVLYQLRTVQATVRHLETFPPERARAACRRASFYGSYSYGAIKRILREALDLEPLPNVSAPPSTWSEPPRFARDVRELLDLPLEVHDEPN